MERKIKKFDDFLALLQGVKKLNNKGEYIALCPAHGDTQPSLSIKQDWGTILICCHAGCPNDNIVRAMGLKMSDLYLYQPEVKTRKVVKTYDYKDIDGKLIYQILRYDKPPPFGYRQPNGEGGWDYHKEGVEPVLYHLPDVIRAVECGDTIYLTEGEKDCDRLWELGLIATTNPFGAGSWKPEYANTLSGASKVVILPDNDTLKPKPDTKGLDHAIAVANSLCGIVKSVKLIEPFSDAIDVSDWLDKGNTIEALETLVEKTPLYTPIRVINQLLYNTPQNTKIASERARNGRETGEKQVSYAKQFDEVMRESEGRQDKKEVADTIGLKVTSDTFRKLLARRKVEGKVRAYRGSHYLIEWIYKDYTVTQMDKNEAKPMLDITLPLGLDEYASLPPRSVVGVAGETSSGKTSLLLEIAELNVLRQPLPIYYWYNEMSETKMIYRGEDFPHLAQAQKEGKFFPVMQTNFEFADVLQPDAINIIDYIDRDDDVFLIGGDIKKLYNALNTGAVVFALQKPQARDLGYGGTMSIKLSNLYIALSIKYEAEDSMHGIAKIVKSKDWKGKINPRGLECEYHTGGKHGRLFIDGIWKRPIK